MKLNLTHLSNFIQIVEWGNISKAAAFLNIAQPALSRQIHTLEETFGTELLRRHPWGVEPTASGTLLLDHARRIEKECLAAKESVHTNKDNPNGSVFLGVPSAYSVSLVPPLLQRMKSRYPNIQVHIVEAFSGTIYEWLVNGRLDLAILYFSKEHDSVESIPFVEEDMVALSSSEKLAGRTVIQLEDLAHKSLIAPWRPHIHRLTLETAFMALGTPFSPSIEIDSLPCMKELAHRGAGFAILPPSSVIREVETGRLASAQISPRITLRTVLGLTPVRQPKSEVQLLSDELKKMSIELAPETGWSTDLS